ncbi:hypothetical protein [Methanospirillum hungatei]|uniref:hypothetical protein n=1 Tax=Methanospirillum hungatei TaxID=2203 RepID=UPI0026ED221D|nr:hypothetical protein [Methanospirillum hungatei]MCA1917453.1 hypothetical protein [Methanospirillum hungatei]
MKKIIIVLLFLLCNFFISLTVSGNINEVPALQIGSEPNDQGKPEFVYYYPQMQEIREKVNSILLCDTLMSLILSENCSLDATEEEQESCETLPEGWSLYPCNGTKVLEALPHLHLSPDKIISGYFYRTFMIGVPFLLVFDADENPSIPEEYLTNDYEKIPPLGDLEILNYISGDKSYESYLETSILNKMIPNHTSVFDRNTWSTHIILNDQMVADANRDRGSSFEVPLIDELKSSKWNWTGDYPERFDPVIYSQNESIIVQFYTYSGLNDQKIVKYTDIYPNGSYIPESEEFLIASGGGGYYY